MTSDASREAAAIARIEALLAAVAPVSRKLANHGYPVEADSALQLDHDALPALPAATGVNRALDHSLHHLKDLQRLLRLGDLPQYVPYTLVRCAIESSATAVWLLDENAITRMQRRVAVELDDANEAKRAKIAAGVDYQTDADKRDQETNRALTEAGLVRKDCRWPYYSGIVRVVDQHEKSAKSLELAWRACSGMAHGKFWALQMMTPPTNTIQLNSTTLRATFTPSFHTLAIVLDKAVDTLLRADNLYDTRRAPMV